MRRRRSRGPPTRRARRRPGSGRGGRRGPRGRGQAILRGEMSAAAPVFDRQEQLERVQAGLLDGEHTFAVYDLKGGGAGFIGITSRRLIVYDRMYLIDRQAMVSIPYSRIVTVAAEAHPHPIAG